MSELLENIESQLTELSVLQSIYPNNDELVIQDQLLYSSMHKFVDSSGKSVKPDKSLPIRLNLFCPNVKSATIVDCVLPFTYPSSGFPHVSVRCDDMTRQKQREFNDNLQKFMSDLEVGETCLYQVLDWVSEYIKNYVPDNKTETTTIKSTKTKDDVFIFTRLWIYSHHIYNKNKRRDILEWSKELQLTGFSMPGKPGVVCAEGEESQCDELWRRLRNLNWKRINITHKESVRLLNPSDAEIASLRKFKDKLKEINFDPHQNAGRNYHMDLGQFFDYLTKHDCKEMFHMLFGVEGKSCSN